MYGFLYVSSTVSVWLQLRTRRRADELRHHHHTTVLHAPGQARVRPQPLPPPRARSSATGEIVFAFYVCTWLRRKTGTEHVQFSPREGRGSQRKRLSKRGERDVVFGYLVGQKIEVRRFSRLACFVFLFVVLGVSTCGET